MNEVAMSDMFSKVLRLIKIFYTIPVTTPTAYLLQLHQKKNILSVKEIENIYLRTTMSKQDSTTPYYSMITKTEQTKNIVSSAKAGIRQIQRVSTHSKLHHNDWTHPAHIVYALAFNT